MIRDEPAAQRLASAVVRELVLCNEARIRATTNVRIALAREIAEARELFQAKVAPELHGIFEGALDARLDGAVASLRERPTAPREPDYVERDTSDDDRDTSGPGRLLLLSIAVMVAGLWVIWWMLKRVG